MASENKNVPTQAGSQEVSDFLEKLARTPAVRPSVQHDANQRSEDDLSHIIITMMRYDDIIILYNNSRLD